MATPKRDFNKLKCCVLGCHSGYEPGKISFFLIPNIISDMGDEIEEITRKRRDAWITAINNPLVSLESWKKPRVCSAHFPSGKTTQVYKTTDDLLTSLKLSSKHDANWVPSLHLNVVGPSDCSTQNEEPMDALPFGTAADTSVLDTLSESNTVCPTDVSLLQEQLDQAGEADALSDSNTVCPTDVSLLQEQLAQAREEIARQGNVIADLRTQLDVTKATLKSTTFYKKIKGDQKMFHFYTGLNSYNLFLTIFFLCEPGAKALAEQQQWNKPKLSLKKQLCLTLIRLRLRLKEQDLAYRFDISVASVSRYVQKWVDVMYVRLQRNFMVWPHRDELKQSMPLSIKNQYPNCVSIIDCFETFIQRHTDVLDRASTYSSYKHHNTMKFLISVAPTGVITFISHAYGGHETDPAIVQSSKFLDNIIPGDTVLADRGFLIDQWITLIGASLITPAFKGRRDRLTQVEVYDSRRVSNVRIHVERVIGQLKRTFTILEGPVSALELRSGQDGLSFVDKIAMVCCCLLNASNGIISR